LDWIGLDWMGGRGRLLSAEGDANSQIFFCFLKKRFFGVFWVFKMCVCCFLYMVGTR